MAFSAIDLYIGDGIDRLNIILAHEAGNVLGSAGIADIADLSIGIKSRSNMQASQIGGNVIVGGSLCSTVNRILFVQKFIDSLGFASKRLGPFDMRKSLFAVWSHSTLPEPCIGRSSANDADLVLIIRDFSFLAVVNADFEKDGCLVSPQAIA